MEENSSLKKKELPIEWRMPEGKMTPFATNMFVQIIENEFKISFFEVKPPLRFNESDPWPEKAIADCVSSVIITADRLPKFIEVLQDQLERYESIMKQRENA